MLGKHLCVLIVGVFIEPNLNGQSSITTLPDNYRQEFIKKISSEHISSPRFAEDNPGADQLLLSVAPESNNQLELVTQVIAMRQTRIKSLESFISAWISDNQFDLVNEIAAITNDKRLQFEIANQVTQQMHSFNNTITAYNKKNKLDFQHRFNDHLLTRHSLQKIQDSNRLKQFLFPDELNLHLRRTAFLVSNPLTHQTKGGYGNGLYFLATYIDMPRRDYPSAGSAIVMQNYHTILFNLSDSILIIDGDLTITKGNSHGNVIICNGNISFPQFTPSKSFIYANGDGDINLNEERAGNDSVVLLAGKSKLEGKEHFLKNRVFYKDNVKANPLGVRFFELSEVGLKVAVKDEKVTIAELSKDSFLAKAFRTGDVIRKINGLKMTSEHDVRRQMRSTVVWDAGIFEVERDGKAQHYLVKPNFFPLDKK
ncbi:MAG: hypothetical protein R3B84_00160 [Zavarzinella sp.]